MGEGTRYEDNLQEKQAQHEALAEALKDYGHSVLHCLYSLVNLGRNTTLHHTNKDLCRAWTCKQSFVQVASILCCDILQDCFG